MRLLQNKQIMMDSDSCNSSSSDYYLYQESRQGIKRYFCCFPFNGHNKDTYLKHKEETKNKLVKQDVLEEDDDGLPTWSINKVETGDDEIDDYLPSWSINEVRKDNRYSRSSNNSDVKTVRFDSSSF